MNKSSNRQSQPFSCANRKVVPVGKELSDNGLVWRKLQDGSGVWRFDFRMNKRRFKYFQMSVVNDMEASPEV